MNTNDLNTALYEKMAAEQDKYRDWLKSQPPEEILHHTLLWSSVFVTLVAKKYRFMQFELDRVFDTR